MCGIEGETYALSTEIIEQIVPKQNPTRVKDARKHIEGIFSWRDSVLKIISLRKLLGFDTYKEKQLKVIHKVKLQHEEWLSEFKECLGTEKTFTKTLDPTQCDLGKWIDQTLHCLKCNDHGFNTLVKEILVEPHTNLHLRGKEFLQRSSCEADCDCFPEIERYKNEVFKALSELESKIELLSNAYERVVVCKLGATVIGITVDEVHQLVNIENTSLTPRPKDLEVDNKLIADHVFQFDGKLVQIVDEKVLAETV